MRNYGIRYADGEDEPGFTPETNYGARIPGSSIDSMNFREGDHQMIPKDYVPENQRNQ